MRWRLTVKMQVVHFDIGGRTYQNRASVLARSWDRGAEPLQRLVVDLTETASDIWIFHVIMPCK